MSKNALLFTLFLCIRPGVFGISVGWKMFGKGIIFIDTFHLIRILLNFAGRASYANFPARCPRACCVTHAAVSGKIKPNLRCICNAQSRYCVVSGPIPVGAVLLFSFLNGNWSRNPVWRGAHPENMPNLRCIAMHIVDIVSCLVQFQWGQSFCSAF